MRLSEINIYPLKSLGGISLKSSVVEERGLQFDRRWMLVNEKNHFLTQRELPQMARFDIGLKNEGLNITFERDNLTIPFQTDSEKTE